MKIASSAPRGPQTFEERNVFAIYVSYYIKIKLSLSSMGGEVSLKLPFILGHVDDANDTDNRKIDSSKFTDCMRSRTPTEIVEEECGHDEIGLNDIKETNDSIDNNCTENANQCDTIQLEEQLRFSHINVNANNNNHNTDFEDDDEDAANNESCHNIITAQVHTENQPNKSTEQITDC